MTGQFREFLERNSVSSAKTMPLVHTTATYHLKKIKDNQALVPQQCDVFRENLSYFFVGRPAYRVRATEGEAEDWELPSCFVFKYNAVKKPKRIFPFDSGAFSGNRMPGYISMMERDIFESSSVDFAPQKIIGAYFTDISSYFEGKPKGTSQFQSEYSLGVFDEEIKAVHRLSMEKRLSRLDDRRLTVEIQSDEYVDLLVESPLAVIVPLPYYKDENFRRHITEVWKAVPISYPISSLSSQEYQALIYDRILSFYNEIGVI